MPHCGGMRIKTMTDISGIIDQIEELLGSEGTRQIATNMLPLLKQDGYISFDEQNGYTMLPVPDDDSTWTSMVAEAEASMLNPAIVDYCADKSIPLPTDIEKANAAWDVADACDCTIQAEDMVALFPGAPEMHTATTFGSLVRLLR